MRYFLATGSYSLPHPGHFIPALHKIAQDPEVQRDGAIFYLSASHIDYVKSKYTEKDQLRAERTLPGKIRNQLMAVMIQRAKDYATECKSELDPLLQNVTVIHKKESGIEIPRPAPGQIIVVIDDTLEAIPETVPGSRLRPHHGRHPRDRNPSDPADLKGIQEQLQDDLHAPVTYIAGDDVECCRIIAGGGIADHRTFGPDFATQYPVARLDRQGAKDKEDPLWRIANGCSSSDLDASLFHNRPFRNANVQEFFNAFYRQKHAHTIGLASAGASAACAATDALPLPPPQPQQAARPISFGAHLLELLKTLWSWIKQNLFRIPELLAAEACSTTAAAPRKAPVCTLYPRPSPSPAAPAHTTRPRSPAVAEHNRSCGGAAVGLGVEVGFAAANIACALF
jgi:hypothetical protein